MKRKRLHKQVAWAGVEGERSTFVRREVEINPRRMLKFKTSLHAVAFSPNNNERGHKADHFEIPAQLFSVPNLTVLGLKGFTAAGLGVDFG